MGQGVCAKGALRAMDRRATDNISWDIVGFVLLRLGALLRVLLQLSLCRRLLLLPLLGRVALAPRSDLGELSQAKELFVLGRNRARGLSTGANLL